MRKLIFSLPFPIIISLVVAEGHFNMSIHSTTLSKSKEEKRKAVIKDKMWYNYHCIRFYCSEIFQLVNVVHSTSHGNYHQPMPQLCKLTTSS